MPQRPPGSACAYYEPGRTWADGGYYLGLDAEIPDDLDSTNGPVRFDGFFPAGPYAMEATWGQDYPVAWVATFKPTGVWPLAAAVSARTAWEAGLVPAGFWDDGLCQPSDAYWDWVRLTDGPDQLARTAMLNDQRAGGALGRVADAIQENVPTPAQVWRVARGALVGGAEVVGEAGGTLLAAFTEAGARGSAKGVVAFWDGLPAAGQAALAIGALVLAIAAVRKLT